MPALGPALPARPLTLVVAEGVPGLGVLGPTEVCLARLEDVGGMDPRWGFKRRRFTSFAPADDSRWRWCRSAVDAGVAGAELAWCDVFNREWWDGCATTFGELVR
jgi:hypothetical protein